MSLFHKIVKSRTDWKHGIDPLWKLQVTFEEYEDLKEFLHDKIVNTYNPYCEREAALYFAEWWKREYSGGPHKKIDVANTIHLFSHSEELYRSAVNGAELLRIKFIRMETTRYLDTLLLQGGLPLKALTQNDGVNRYELYLKYIIKYVSTHYLNNWESIDFIQGFNNYISPCFQNDVMYELTLAIVKAIYYDDDSYFPFNINDIQFENLVNNLRKTKSDSIKILSENPFSVDWFIGKKNSELTVKYEIECQSVISDKWANRNLQNLGDPFSRLNIIIEDQESQKYIRKNNGDYSSSFAQRKINGVIKDFGNAVISGQIITNTNQIFDVSLPNSDIPDFKYPILATKIDGDENNSRWKIINNPIEGNRNVAICPSDWYASNSYGESLKINETNINWFEFDKEIEVFNGSEALRFDSNYSLDYKVDFGLPLIEWIQKSNYFPIRTFPQIRVFDFDENRLHPKKYKVFFKQNKKSEWLENDSTENLPIGLIDFKVLIENRVTIRKRFFNCGTLDIEIGNSTTSSGEIFIQWDSGTITPLNIQDGLIVDEIGHHRWKISYNDDLKNYPETINFELDPHNEDSTKLRINVSTPFKGVVLLNPSGESVSNGQILCANALLGYRCLVMGYDHVPVNIQYFKNEQDNLPAEVKTKFYKGINNKLQMLENDIQTMFRINSKSFLEYNDNGTFYLQIGRDLRFQLDHFNTILEFEDGIIEITDKNGNTIPDFQYDLFFVPLNCSPENIYVTQIPKNEDTFHLNQNEIIGNEIIVFSSSGKGAHLQIRPRYINLSGIKREQSHDEIINSIRDEMLENSFDNLVWKIALKYFEITIEGHLPFKVFNHLTAISKEKKLMSCFFIYLLTNHQYDEAKLMKELIRFEGEFGQAWHWIKYEVWLTSIDGYLESISIDDKFFVEVKIQLLKKVINLLSFHAIDKESLTNMLFSLFFGQLHVKEIIPQPYPFEIRNEKSKFNNGNGIYIPIYVSELFPNIPKQYRKLFSLPYEDVKQWGGLLLSPLFAALAFTGHNEVFEKNNYWHLQRVLYYLDIDREWYFSVFEKMVKRIYQQHI